LSLLQSSFVRVEAELPKLVQTIDQAGHN
jgi:hypothetical protein